MVIDHVRPYARTFVTDVLSPPIVARRRPPLWRLLVVCGALGFLSLAFSGVAPAGAAPVRAAMPTQDPAPTTTIDPSATLDSVAKESAPSANSEPATGNDAKSVAEENRRIWLVVAGLVAVAIALSLITIRYWRQTKPFAPGTVREEPAPTVAPPMTTQPAAEVKSPGRRSRRAVAGADHASADEEWEPRGTSEHHRVEVAAAGGRVRPSPEQRRAAFQRSGRT